MVRSITTWEKGQDIDVQKSTHSYQPFITQSPFHLWTKLDHCSHVNQVAGSNNWVKLSPSGLGLPLQLSQGHQLVPQLQLSLHKLLVTGSNAQLEILPCRQCRPPPGAASAGAASAPELLPSHISHYLVFKSFLKFQKHSWPQLFRPPVPAVPVWALGVSGATAAPAATVQSWQSQAEARNRII